MLFREIVECRIFKNIFRKIFLPITEKLTSHKSVEKLKACTGNVAYEESCKCWKRFEVFCIQNWVYAIHVRKKASAPERKTITFNHNSLSYHLYYLETTRIHSSMPWISISNSHHNEQHVHSDLYVFPPAHQLFGTIFYPTLSHWNAPTDLGEFMVPHQQNSSYIQIPFLFLLIQKQSLEDTVLSTNLSNRNCFAFILFEPVDMELTFQLLTEASIPFSIFFFISPPRISMS